MSNFFVTIRGIIENPSIREINIRSAPSTSGTFLFKAPVGMSDLVVVEAQILVARASQKAIILGEKGSRLKSIGAAARREIERFLGVRVYLQLFVKVDAKWFSRETTLTDLGL